MSLFFASLGTIIGSIYFILGANKPLVISLVLLILSTMVFTTMSHRRKEIISLFTFILLVFINYSLRSEFLEYYDYSKHLQSTSNQVEIINSGKEKYFKTEYIIKIISIQERDSLKAKLIDFVFPKQLLLKIDSHIGLRKGDIVEINKELELKKLEGFRANLYRSKKVFFEIQNIKSDHIKFISHKTVLFDELRSKISKYFQATLSEENAEIVQALLFGARNINVNKDFTRSVRNLGLGHFFAASGFHLLILSLILNWILLRLKAPLIVSNTVISLSSLAYIGLANFSPSIIRAAIFIFAYMILQALKRKAISAKLLIIIAAIVLFIDPYTIFDLGFQFSYLATLSIITWQPLISKKIAASEFCSKFPSFFKDIVSVTLAAQILLFPFIAYYFNSLQIWTLVANILLSPLLSLITVSSFLGLSFLVEPLLNFFKYLLVISQGLPFINAHIDVDRTSLVILIILFNLIALIIFKGELSKTEAKAHNYHPYRNFEENFVNFMKTVFGSRLMQATLLSSALLMLIATNLRPIGIEKYIIRNGTIVDQEFKHEKDEYFVLAGHKALIIKERSLKSIERLNGLEEVSFLFLPELNSKDIYLKTLIELVNPQFIICSIKSNDSKSKENLDFISSMANTIVDSGTIYVSKDKFWKITNE